MLVKLGFTEFCIFQGHSGGKSTMLDVYTRCLCKFVAAVATHSVSLLLQHFAEVLRVVQEKLLSNNMSM